jgi:rhodanese-related sulfurtransferase
MLSDTYTPCAQLSRAIQEGAQLIDVRSAAECAEGMLPGAVNLPLDEIETALERLDFDRTLLLYCRSGHRSELARQKLSQMGHRDCRNIGSYSTFERCA